MQLHKEMNELPKRSRRASLLPSSSNEDSMDRDDEPSANKRRRMVDASPAEASTEVVDGCKRSPNPIHTTRAATIRTGQQDGSGEGEVTLRRCLHLLQFGDKDLTERPARIMQEHVPMLLFAERPKQKRTASKWGSAVQQADRWVNSRALDYFPDGQNVGARGVRKRYGRIVRGKYARNSAERRQTLPCVNFQPHCSLLLRGA
jgi:hypothetical protein